MCSLYNKVGSIQKSIESGIWKRGRREMMDDIIDLDNFGADFIEYMIVLSGERFGGHSKGATPHILENWGQLHISEETLSWGTNEKGTA